MAGTRSRRRGWRRSATRCGTAPRWSGLRRPSGRNERPAHRRWEGLDGGEPVRDFVERVHRDMQLFLAERGIAPAREDLPVWRIAEPGRKILLIAHAGTNAVAFGHLLGLQPVPWEWERFVLGHASISRIESLATGDGHTFSLTKLGDVEHLNLEERTR
ncbi:MAG: histidine phosphatase family protein [Acidimicrobiales bacterium]